MQLSSANSFTDPVLRQRNIGFDVAVAGTFVGTVTTQLSKDGSTGWIDIGSVTEPDVLTADHATAWYVRAGFKAGEYTSGTADVEVY